MPETTAKLRQLANEILDAREAPEIGWDIFTERYIGYIPNEWSPFQQTYYNGPFP